MGNFIKTSIPPLQILNNHVSTLWWIFLLHSISIYVSDYKQPMTPNHPRSVSILMPMCLCTFPFLALIFHTRLPVPFSNILLTLLWPGSPMRIWPHPQCSLVVTFSLLYLYIGLEMKCPFGSSLPLWSLYLPPYLCM